MPKLIDLRGKSFGEWVVLDKPRTIKKGRVFWSCLCSCKKEKLVRAENLINNNNRKSRSCGCKKISRRFNTLGLEYDTGAKNRLFRTYKEMAARRNHVFEISREHFLILTTMICYYCGKPPRQISRSKYPYALKEYSYNGIDRVDNSKGYIEGNVVACCKKCNWAKREYSVKDFLEWVEEVYNFKIRQLS